MKPEAKDTFYCICWPQSQKVQEADPQGVHWTPAHNDETLFVEAAWFDQLPDSPDDEFEKKMLEFWLKYSIAKGYADPNVDKECLSQYKEELLSIAAKSVLGTFEQAKSNAIEACKEEIAKGLKWHYCKNSTHEAPHVLKRQTGDNPVKEFKYALYYGKHYIDVDDLLNLPKEDE